MYHRVKRRSYQRKKTSSVRKQSYGKLLLATQLSQGNSVNTRNEDSGQIKLGLTTLEYRAHLFGHTVADSLLQCDAKDWPLLKKKIMDLFFEYEGRESNASSHYPTSTNESTIPATILANLY